MRWLINLVATPDESEAILGDLQEERSQITARDGDAAARRWYIRQSMRTVAHLAVSPFRQGPLTMVAIGIGGMVLGFPMSWAVNGVAAGIVSRVEVYPYVPAQLYWQIMGFMPPLVMGFLSAWVLGKRAMSGTIAMFMAVAVMVSVVDPIMMLFVLPPRPHLTYTFSFFATRVVMLLTVWGLTIFAGAMLGITLKRRLTPPAAVPG